MHMHCLAAKEIKVRYDKKYDLVSDLRHDLRTKMTRDVMASTRQLKGSKKEYM